MPEITEETKRILIIAYSSGYEHGHYDTCEGLFWCDGKSETHDHMAAEWVRNAMVDGTLDRGLAGDVTP